MQRAIRTDESDQETTLDRLQRAVESPDSDDPAVRVAPDQQMELARNSVAEALSGDEVPLDEETIKQNLDEILLLLVAGRSSDSHGKALMSDLVSVFGAHISPGTIYPRLHDLEESGQLSLHELVHTKEYSIDDEEALLRRVESSMEQHFAMGLFFQAALDELD